MSAAYIIACLNDAQVTVTADGDKLLLRPEHKVSEELRGLVRLHKAEILAELRERWPSATAKKRDFSVRGHPIKPWERAKQEPPRPQVITSRWRRRR